MCIGIYVCMISVSEHISCTHACTHTHTYIHTYIHAYMHARIHTHTHIYTHTCAYTPACEPYFPPNSAPRGSCRATVFRALSGSTVSCSHRTFHSSSLWLLVPKLYVIGLIIVVCFYFYRPFPALRGPSTLVVCGSLCPSCALLG
jgi:hypothetical protein